MADDTTALSRIEAPLDRARVGGMAIDKFAGVRFQEVREAIEFCKLVAQAEHGLPKYLRHKAADCLIITTQALRWKLDPAWVMQHSYISREDGIINYENFVFAAIIIAAEVLKGRPRYIFAGEGEERTCTVSATFRGESEPCELTTPPLRQCRPKRNEKGEAKGSQLWDKDPDQQLGYYAIRNWGRRYTPELLGGVYSRDEFPDSTQDEIAAPKPDLMARLPGRVEGAGYSPGDLRERVEALEEAEAAKTARKDRQGARKARGEGIAEGGGEGRASENKPTGGDASGGVGGFATAEAYEAHLRDWLNVAGQGSEITARWQEEERMRSQLTLKERDHMADIVSQRLEQIG